MKKEQTFFSKNLFCCDKSHNESFLTECTEKEHPFNPQIILATSGTANAGIDNPNVCGVFRFDFPPSVEYAIQEEGRAARRIGACALTDKYTVYISLESVLSLIRRILISEETTNEFKAVLKKNFHIALTVFVLPSCCI